jgi:hypothetical protein
MCIKLEEPSSEGWVDPDPWIFLVLDLVFEGRELKAMLLCLASDSWNRVGMLSYESAEDITHDLYSTARLRAIRPAWNLL